MSSVSGSADNTRNVFLQPGPLTAEQRETPDAPGDSAPATRETMCTEHGQFQPCQHVGHLIAELPKEYAKPIEFLRLNPDLSADFLAIVNPEFRAAAEAALKNSGPQEGRRLKLTTASGINEKRVRWLWDGHIPLGELTLFIGKGGIGKSTEFARQVALVTTGKMEGEYIGTPRDVVYLAAEDSLESTVKPRMVAAGADLERVHFLTIEVGAEGELTTVTLENDLPFIKEAIRQVDAVAVYFDPLSSNLGGDRNKGNEMRPIMEKIRKAAEETNTAWHGLGHVKKERVGNIIDAFLGSVEMSNVCRSAFGMVADTEEEGTYLLSSEKNNLGPKPPSLRYKIEGAEYPYTENGFTEMMQTSRIVILGETDRTASQVMEEAMQSGGGPAVQDAVDWLRGFLEEQGKTPKKEVVSASRKEGITLPTLDRAAKRLKVERSSGGFPNTVRWKLPDPDLSILKVD